MVDDPLDPDLVQAQVKIKWLVAAHVVGGLMLAATALLTHSSVAAIGLLTLTLTEIGLLGIWGGLGVIEHERRFPAVIAGSLYLSVVIGILVGAPLVGHLFLLLAITVPVVMSSVIFLSIFQLEKPGMHPASLANEEASSPAFQFSIRNLLWTTAIVAVVLGVHRALPDTLRPVVAAMLLMAIVPCCFISVMVATLAIGRPAPRLAVTITAVCGMAVILVSHLELSSSNVLSYVVCPAIVGFEAIVTAASLLVVRSCGWRLVFGNGDGLQAEGTNGG